jgi:hypothetical protein
VRPWPEPLTLETTVRTLSKPEYSDAINAAIKECERIYPIGPAGYSDGAPHIYVNDDGVFGYGDTVGWAALDEKEAENIAEELKELDAEAASADSAVFFDAMSSYEVPGTSTW